MVEEGSGFSPEAQQKRPTFVEREGFLFERPEGEEGVLPKEFVGLGRDIAYQLEGAASSEAIPLVEAKGEFGVHLHPARSLTRKGFKPKQYENILFYAFEPGPLTPDYKRSFDLAKERQSLLKEILASTGRTDLNRISYRFIERRGPKNEAGAKRYHTVDRMLVVDQKVKNGSLLKSGVYNRIIFGFTDRDMAPLLLQSFQEGMTEKLHQPKERRHKGIELRQHLHREHPLPPQPSAEGK